MKAKEILKFVLSGWIPVEKCGVVKVSEGDSPEKYFGELCDSDDFLESGEFFYFWTDDEDRERAIRFALSFTDLGFVNYEFPTQDGWYILFKIVD